MSDYTFSEHGEDILVHRLLLWKERGFYVDCGAYHSRNMSLTARLRLFGWNGINIDIDKNVVNELCGNVLGTKSICAAVGAVNGKHVTFHRYGDPVLNTISDEQYKHLETIEKSGELFTCHLGMEVVETKNIDTILKENSVSDKIDYLNVDVEGVELEALVGFPWSQQRPGVVSVEIHRLDLLNAGKNPVVQFMLESGYYLQSYVFHTAIFCVNGFDTELCHRVSFARL